MEDICRLCCSAKFVNNDIFDEENALYLKMSLYLPIKVFKNDLLPQKVCDKCSCKVNDFYQFCNEAIEVQNRLRATFMVFGVTPSDSIDLTEIDIKNNIHSPPPAPPVVLSPPRALERPEQPERCDQGTQTELVSSDTKHTLEFIHHQDLVPVKEEPVTIKTEVVDSNEAQEDNCLDDIHSDTSDEVSLLSLKKKKRKDKNKNCNGNIKENKNSKRKEKPKELKACLLSTLQAIKKKVKTEPNDGEVFNCCICFMQCHGRSEMLRHYREHSKSMKPEEPPAAPPAPDSMRCIRCQKRLQEGEWAAHWAGHWARDRRPLRCAVCARTFKDHSHILKHSLKHSYSAGAGAVAGDDAPDKMFLCDVCEERFAYMRCLLAHRTLAHPEASARAPALRCGVCARAFLHHNSLRRHLAAHSGQRPFLCNVCGKALSSREHLKFHIRIHTGDKQHACRVCGKGFVKKCNLTLHERVHSGEKPHVCEHCGKAFSQRSTLVIHERYHSGARPYACQLCGRGFVARGLLTMHLKTTCI